MWNWIVILPNLILFINALFFIYILRTNSFNIWEIWYIFFIRRHSVKVSIYLFLFPFLSILLQQLFLIFGLWYVWFQILNNWRRLIYLETGCWKRWIQWCSMFSCSVNQYKYKDVWFVKWWLIFSWKSVLRWFAMIQLANCPTKGFYK